MIRKPVGADRPSPLRRTADAAMDVQRAVQHTGRRAGSAFQVLLLGWLTLGMGIGALTAGSPGATLIGLAVTGCFAFLLYRGIHSGRKAPAQGAAADAVACDSSPSRGNSVAAASRPGGSSSSRVVHYSSSRLLSKAATYLVIAVVLAALLPSLFVVPAIWMAISGVAVLAWALGDRVALSFDERTVTVADPRGRQTLTWEQVDDVIVRPRRVWLHGVLPIGSAPHIEFVTSRSGESGPGVPAKLLDLDKDELATLLKVMIFARSGGLDLVDSVTGELISNKPEESPAASARPQFGRRTLPA